MNAHAGKVSIATEIANWIAATDEKSLPADVRDMSERLLLDIVGLCAASRDTDYVRAAVAVGEPGVCTAFGHKDRFDMYSAALINGTAAHGEDFDDTFEGGPVHSGAVIVPAVFAVCERFGLSGQRALLGVAVGIEFLCRLGLVTPKAIHKAGFHPTAVLGTLAATAGVGAALGLSRDQLVHALGVAGSMSSGIIEYLKDGSWTKRMHPGWSAQSGIRAALLAKNGFVGPLTVLEGEHGFFHSFAPSRAPDFDSLLRGIGEKWVMTGIAFKPYACGTMTQPYIDCAIELAKSGVKPDDIESIVCEVGEGTVHRLWEPLASKQAVPNGYAGKFSTPYCVAVGILDGAAGLAAFTDERTKDAKTQKLAAKVSYVVDPNNPYPDRFTGHLRATLKDGSVREVRRDNMRGGAHDPLTRGELEGKFTGNMLYGGLSGAQAVTFKKSVAETFKAGDLSKFTGFRLS
ncbi:MmgE/Prp family protein [Terrihabitans soli]|uniref:MmgE/Prp family protein n=1 Tax=Terrihabitans soli TaxID=708113 RepID=A0A6S6QRU2_9HYPH|nr:MmgE/PrpD family protein [Terrihabitans soli]BCJ90445.1 MmgE/Prp family protein [Terrihabitans soli]